MLFFFIHAFNITVFLYQAFNITVSVEKIALTTAQCLQNFIDHGSATTYIFTIVLTGYPSGRELLDQREKTVESCRRAFLQERSKRNAKKPHLEGKKEKNKSTFEVAEMKWH